MSRADLAAQRALFEAFLTWAKSHLGRSYSLEVEEGIFVDPVTRWCFNGYRAGQAALASQAPIYDDVDLECQVPPFGWRCTRGAGHDGPCAAIECPEDFAAVKKGMERLASEAPAVQQERVAWRVAQFWSSANPGTKVLMLAQGAKEIAEWGKRSDFLGWQSAAPSPQGGAEDAARLDWLERQVADSQMVRFVCSGEVLRFVQLIRFGQCDNFPTVEGIRAAIDAARKMKK